MRWTNILSYWKLGAFIKQNKHTKTRNIHHSHVFIYVYWRIYLCIIRVFCIYFLLFHIISHVFRCKRIESCFIKFASDVTRYTKIVFSKAGLKIRIWINYRDIFAVACALAQNWKNKTICGHEWQRKKQLTDSVYAALIESIHPYGKKCLKRNYRNILSNYTNSLSFHSLFQKFRRDDGFNGWWSRWVIRAKKKVLSRSNLKKTSSNFEDFSQFSKYIRDSGRILLKI